MAFYVFDLDGTLADCSHRQHLAEAGDWDAFFAACPDDKPILPTIELLLRLWNTRTVKIEIWSGRSDAVRPQTEEWLCRHGIQGNLLTCMRTAGDHRPDDELKLEFLRGTEAPDIIFDDRKRVVDMWRREGLVCFQVAPGDF
jgi:phosphoglycolate phosphatase-like HAD superfamily hydrolase